MIVPVLLRGVFVDWPRRRGFDARSTAERGQQPGGAAVLARPRVGPPLLRGSHGGHRGGGASRPQTVFGIPGRAPTADTDPDVVCGGCRH